MTAKQTPDSSDDQHLVVLPSRTLARPLPSIEENVLALYMSRLRSPASRRSAISVLNRAARIFDAFDNHIEERNSQATATSYDWGAPGALTFSKVQAAVAIMAEELKENGEPKISTARLLCSMLKGLARTAFNQKLLGVDERMRIDDVDPPELTGATRGRRLTQEELDRVFAACDRDQTKIGIRDKAVLWVMLGTGLRRFEVSGLDLADYSKLKKGKTMYVVLRVRAGKGNKHAEAIGPAEVAEAVDTWIEARGDVPGALFWSSHGRAQPLDPKSRLSAAGVYMICDERGRTAGVSFAPHDLRRSAITRFLEETGDLSLAKQFGRHASTETTARYDKRDREALIAAFTGMRK